ncbi:hypothetical protein [Anaerovorax sp. IOR16]|uniref:hypothetical protein n=1 Tax=Anaerovorax sp. IOR16 TaxID=2773458 RepID=UPI0019D1EFF9|nr:hypothetical protein [Anaerovorax sp. IOR16]
MVNSEQADYGKVKRMNYRVVVPQGITDGELISMFKEVTPRKCDEITIWCYLSREEINQYKPYTVAMVEKTRKTAVRITRR